ncbi:MAG: PAS domain-containing sensor histidine kinase [Cyclobacteriaceae bacterium]
MVKEVSCEKKLFDGPKHAIAKEILSNSTDIVLVFDEYLNVSFANAYALSHLNYEESQLLGQHITQIFPKRQQKSLETIIEKADERLPIRERRSFLHVRGKRNIPVSLTLCLLASDTQIKYLLIAKDQRQYIKATDALRQKNEDLKTLIYRASHDLKGPLASVKGLFNLLKSEPEDIATLKSYLTLIEKSVNKLEDTLSGLLEVGLSSKKDLKFSLINIRAFLEEVISQFDNYPGRKEVLVHITANSDLTLHTEEKIFQSIFQNLVENSIKYRKPHQNDAVTKISVRRYKQGLKFKVKDNGLGMDRNSQKRAFDMFYRGHEHSEGSGLGLFIVKNNAEKLGGEIGIKTTPNLGTEIWVYLPDKQPH